MRTDGGSTTHQRKLEDRSEEETPPLSGVLKVVCHPPIDFRCRKCVARAVGAEWVQSWVIHTPWLVDQNLFVFQKVFKIKIIFYVFDLQISKLSTVKSSVIGNVKTKTETKKGEEGS